jgi:FAD binding domain
VTRNGAEPVPDVVIAGYGPAGAAAAIAAHDAGCRVLVLESTERGGGNTRYSGGFLFDVPDEAVVAHLDALCFGRTDRQVLEAYAAGLHDLDGWLRSLGGTTAPFDPPPARLPAPFPSWPPLPRNPNRPRLPSWAVFDEAARRAGPLNGLLGTPNDYVWSPDNSAEVDRGWILSAGDPAELAGRMGVDPEVLTGTLERYNASARAGRDEVFGRSADTLVPLDLGRLYAIETWPGIAGTTGGPRHDERARVLRPDGRPIAGLYAAGAVSLAWGYLIEHGGGLTNAMVFGRIAGAEAARHAARAAPSPAARA